MKKIYIIILSLFLFLTNNVGAFIDLKKYAECETDVASTENFFKAKTEGFDYRIFKYIAYDKENLFWEYDHEKEIFKQKKIYNGKKFLKSEQIFQVSAGKSYWIGFNKINGRLEIFWDTPSNLVLAGNCEKTNKSKINKTKFN